METQEFLKSRLGKALLGMSIVLSAVMIAKFGYMFGQWLFQLIH